MAERNSERRRERRRRGARDVGKGVLYLAGAGAVVALLANLDDLKSSKEVKDHWWLVPVAVLVIGYLFRKRGNPYAGAILAVGGALFALGYAARQAQAKQQQQQGQPKPGQPVKQGETGAPFPANPFAGGMPLALPQGPQNAVWVQTPDGQFVRMARPQLPMQQASPFTPFTRMVPPFIKMG
ncbi:hypothetical protein [Polyangium aurulentum]|uniref:hypothetical protein n=1 Tax=Polyangium aurulentum TaxID=2567896 RepID=UPI0010AE135A|nr:hypothetical protein [Polyangium aurulentum]UQA58589.1 hypothetical protein E8A73_046365 [Polyangium aurulentum]